MIPVFFRPEQSCDAAVGYSPSAGKPAQVVKDWHERFQSDIAIHSDFRPANEKDFISAHDANYVMNVLSGKEKNGFGNRIPEVNESLKYTTGSLLAAAEYAVMHNTVACSPTSGFHHAGFDFGGGFCTFNGLMVAAIRLKQAGLVHNVMILDGDAHHGNGTESILHQCGIDWVHHITAGKSYNTAEEALKCADLTSRIRFSKPDLIIYQAGADIHVDDPLGGLLTTEQMAERDRLVFRSALAHGIPLVWNLAGGYQRDEAGSIEPVLALHRQTMAICIEEYL